MVLLLFPANLYSQEIKGVSSDATGQYDALINSVDAALASERDNTERLKTQFIETKSLGKTLAIDLNAYQARLSSHGNLLLLLPETRIEALEKAKIENLSDIKAVLLQLKEHTENLSSANQIRNQAEEQYALNEKQLSEIKQSGQKNENTRKLTKNLGNLLELIAAKKNLLDKIAAFHTKQIGALEEIQRSLLTISEKFEQQIKERKREALFQRKYTAFSFLTYERIAEDTRGLSVIVTTLFSKEKLSKQIQTIQANGIVPFTVTFVLLAVVVLLFKRFRNLCIRMEESDALVQFPWRKRTFKIFHQSLILIGVTLLLYVLKSIHLSVFGPSGTNILLYGLTVWLGTAWWLDFLTTLEKKGKSEILGVLSGYSNFLIFLTRYFVLAYIVVAWMIGSERAILILGRMVFEITLFIWYLTFIRNLQRAAIKTTDLPATIELFLRSFLPVIGYIIFGGGLLIDLIGYGSFALYWNLSWGRTALIFLWGYLLFQVLKEWSQYLKQSADAKLDEAAKHAYPIRWFINRLCWLIWLVVLVLSTGFAWGARQAIIVNSVHYLNKQIIIGSLTFSLMSLFYAFLILFLTLAGSRIWRNILNKKILTESVLEPGLKESIETISVYLFWGIGMVIALNIMGVSSTSMAVVFGALSIGLGFGLQNIFNNFISGIILLFERPIQVGDAVELNGIWGEVKKINVRATVVQTYDNASLIIPNSEFISSQVTNWSFKDMRLRRKVTVGVAYGSDIELVRKTLLEAADNNQLVLKVPKPDVMFTDFGDSALIFVLRIWTDVNRMLICETNIRFEIDRLFRERGIEISFPQRDIHIRSITGDDKLSIES
jgi:potassium-dependent mechanosensitive channel